MPLQTARRPNVVLILTDDHAAHAVGAYGSLVNETPRIDEIAGNGWVLANCFATNALCSPSRASILTGTYSHVNGVRTLSTPLDNSQPTFISLLKEAGYRTAVVGKWHLGEGEGHDPQGFDYWDVLIDQGEYFDPTFLSPAGRRTVPGYATDVITDLALEWVQGLEGEEPWVVLINHKAPHRPWQPDAKHANMYKDPIPVPRTFTDDLATRSVATRRATMGVAEFLNMADLKELPPEGLSFEELAVWKYQRYMEDYLACVASVDDNVGRVTDWLRASGQFEDTLLMYTSDQGFFLGDHGWFDKRFMYEEALRMPFVLSYPAALAPGKTFHGITTNVDVAQLILDAAGVAHHERMQGRSIWPELRQAPVAGPVEGMYYRYFENDDAQHRAPAHYGYRSERYKIIYFYNDGLGLPGTGRAVFHPEWELYDLVADPEEIRNVFHDPAYASVRAQMQVKLWRRQHEVGDEPHHSQARPVGA
ncbi:putative sulfatase [Arthrobacter sp. PAMC 25486]|uniref:sulfatase family protein n=1 Tax=Arthrobacter sp. PAMC 25486 TaxID=1494608 RepID=UPI000535C0B2|nr:sulfatase [Arthrobacter sp. PAMC 25486]AIY00458.1 putative sulfatase [Arthrobacter sp. PAMC 25486]